MLAGGAALDDTIWADARGNILTAITTTQEMAKSRKPRFLLIKGLRFNFNYVPSNKDFLIVGSLIDVTGVITTLNIGQQ